MRTIILLCAVIVLVWAGYSVGQDNNLVTARQYTEPYFVKNYISLKALGAIQLVKINNGYALKISNYDPTTGVKLPDKVRALSTNAILAKKQEMLDVISNINQMIQDAPSAPVYTP